MLLFDEIGGLILGDSLTSSYPSNEKLSKSIDDYRMSVRMMNYIKHKRALINGQKWEYEQVVIPKLQELLSLVRNELE